MLSRHGRTQEAVKCYKDTKELVEQQGCTLSSVLEQVATSLNEAPARAPVLFEIPFSSHHSLQLPIWTESKILSGLPALSGKSLEQLAAFSNPIRIDTETLTRNRTKEASDQVSQDLAAKTQAYRNLQRNGVNVERQVRGHIILVQDTLENTINDRKRRALWTILAQSQILVRLSITKEREMVRARTWNETAIASGQYADDALLVAAAIGHLAHLHLIWQHDTVEASHLLDQACDYGHDHPALDGWFSIVRAAIAAKEGKIQQSEDFIRQATETAHTVAHTPEYADAFFTDFGVVGVTAFAGNCLLKSGAPAKALGQLTSMNLEELADNRHASALYDISASYAALGELEPAQAYALRSI